MLHILRPKVTKFAINSTFYLRAHLYSSRHKLIPNKTKVKYFF